jgi:hypothetical protein
MNQGMPCRKPSDVPPISSSGLDESFPVMLPSMPKEHAVKKSRYTEEQIAYTMKQAETGTSVAEVDPPDGDIGVDVLPVEEAVWWAGRWRASTAQATGG